MAGAAAGGLLRGRVLGGRPQKREQILPSSILYDPKIGRFIAEDPIKFSGGVNHYCYVANSPANFTDPTGEVIGIAIGAAAVLVATGVAVTVFYPEYAPGWLKTVITSFLPLGPAADALGPEIPDAAIKIKQRRDQERELACSMEPCVSVPEACPECQGRDSCVEPRK